MNRLFHVNYRVHTQSLRSPVDDCYGAMAAVKTIILVGNQLSVPFILVFSDTLYIYLDSLVTLCLTSYF